MRALVLKEWCCELLWLLCLVGNDGVLRHHVRRRVPHEQLLIGESRWERVLQQEVFLCVEGNHVEVKLSQLATGQTLRHQLG